MNKIIGEKVYPHSYGDDKKKYKRMLCMLIPLKNLMKKIIYKPS